MIKDIFVSMAATLILEAVRRPDNAAVGKVTDTLPIKPGSRVSEYWAGRYELDDYTGRPKRLKLGEADATDICLRYGLHSIEFGNWVNDNERQNALVAIDESLADLAAVFGVPLETIGLNGSLAIAFGARGRGGTAAAFYAPGYTLINLTKTQGAGTLAHEYGHALDYVFARNGWHLSAPSGGRVTNIDLQHIDKATPRGVMERAFRPMFIRKDGQRSAWIENLRQLPEYWNRRNEIWARCFEQYVATVLEQQGKHNYFLTDHVKSYRPYAYLTADILKKAAPHIREYSLVALGAAQPAAQPTVQDKAAGKKLRDALNDVRAVERFNGLSAKAAALLWLTWSPDPDAQAMANDFQEEVIQKELNWTYLEPGDDDNLYYLTDRGRAFVSAVRGRLQTFQNVAEGTDLFPDDAGIASIGDVEGPDIDTAFI